MKFLSTMSITALSASAALAVSFGAHAAPMTYNGTATIQAGFVNDVDSKLTDFLNETPMVGDTISFSAVFDPDTIGAGVQAAPPFGETVFYDGGLTSIEFTIGTTTLSATVGDPSESGVIATTADTDAQVGIPFFTDGYSITIGSPFAGDRWAANLFFYNAVTDLTTADAPAQLPNISDFEFAGFGFRSFRDGTSQDTAPGSFGSLLDTIELVDPTGGGGGTGGGGTGGGGTTVSEPGSIALLLSGLGAFATLRRRRL